MRRICPYPGLRPFTEEESIFFKGRDMHIRQIVKLLERNKMAFITGASGDGKSSMVYAGVVPYIRAGFFKAKYNGWLIVDFKPQKNPLLSLSEAFAAQTGMDAHAVESELEYGFSSLVELYKKSEFCPSGNGDHSNEGRSLLIIADQFEEVFTNSENFSNGRPSDDTYTTVNLLLETISISIAEDLPIYVIFTMRSDFISQCTFFKSLPEYIAYSQFFVPQLKRTEIRQVIEEPAKMAGGSVAPRLTENIINNLGTGFDQLPVLQHALNMLWKVADDGAQELDLIHLAKIAGISRDALGDDDRGEFDRWFVNLPDYQHKYFEKPDLNNVINAQAGILYESAYDYFLQNADWAAKSITKEESKDIIKAVFKSLTKVDNNRPVRNRCTISEITGIINKDNITNATVCGVINIFRTPENALLRPFSVPGHTFTEYLSGDTVLDVTHEALIRNWKLLTVWNLEDQTDMKDYFDLNTQMQLWIKSDRKPEYLLNSGSYNYFNQWFERSHPNAFMFVKYDNTRLPQREKMRNARCKYENYVDFLEASNMALLSRERSRKRRIKLIIVALITFIVSLSMLVWWALDEREKAVHQSITAEKERQRANDEKLQAEIERQNAQMANMIAEQQRDTARLLANRAIAAKNESEKARRTADFMRHEADRLRMAADSNRLYAEDQRIKAENDRNELQRQIELTNEANEKSARFNMMAMSNLLAMKAKNSYDDKMLNLRLVMMAYKLAKDYNVENTADLYDAVLFALEENKMISPMRTTSSKLMKFTTDYEGGLVCISQYAQIYGYKLVDGKTKEYVRNTKHATKLPLQNALFLDPDNIIYSTSDHNTYYRNVKTDEKIKVSSQGDVIQAATMTMDAKYIVAAFQGGRVIVLDSKDPDGRIINALNLKTKITGLCCSPNNNEVYLLTSKGELIKWSIKDGKQKQIFAQKKLTASCIVAIPDKRQVAVCFANGTIQFVDMRTDTQVFEMLGSHSGFKDAVYDTETGFLVISSVDKRISIINTRDITAKPVIIEEHSLNRAGVLCVGITGNMVYALTEDNEIRYFNYSIEPYIKEIDKLAPYPLKQEEIELLLGRDFLNY
jgi:hypothetical protein